MAASRWARESGWAGNRILGHGLASHFFTWELDQPTAESSSPSLPQSHVQATPRLAKRSLLPSMPSIHPSCGLIHRLALSLSPHAWPEPPRRAPSGFPKIWEASGRGSPLPREHLARLGLRPLDTTSLRDCTRLSEEPFPAHKPSEEGPPGGLSASSSAEARQVWPWPPRAGHARRSHREVGVTRKKTGGSAVKLPGNYSPPPRKIRFNHAKTSLWLMRYTSLAGTVPAFIDNVLGRSMDRICLPVLASAGEGRAGRSTVGHSRHGT